jgi:sorting nexin-5/6/32
MFEKNETTQDNLSLEISDAISEKESVKFTINIKTEIPSYTAARGQTYSVVRSYSDFVWLHTSLSENELYYGLLIPPKPYKPDFESSRSVWLFQ